MTAPTAPTQAGPSPRLRARALSYLRTGRVHVHHAASAGPVTARTPTEYVQAVVHPAANAAGMSVLTRVWNTDGWWECDEHPGENTCAHRLAVQMVTGHAHLGGRCHA